MNLERDVTALGRGGCYKVSQARSDRDLVRGSGRLTATYVFFMLIDRRNVKAIRQKSDCLARRIGTVQRAVSAITPF